MTTPDLEYVGFWRRTVAYLIDYVLLLAVVTFLFLVPALMQSTFLVSLCSIVAYVGCAVYSPVFWVKKQGTIGKLAVGARVVDAQTGETITKQQAVVRYLGYFLSGIVFGLGFFWAAFDPKKQGWHDKLAGTVVVRNVTAPSFASK